MLEIVNLSHGEIVNHTYGAESADSLTLDVIGLGRNSDEITVNGVPAQRSGEMFKAKIALRQADNDIVVKACGNRGTASREIKVKWDKQSFKRINFCIDDHIYCFNEVAKSHPKSIFDHFYFKKMRELYEKYQVCTTLNLFFEDARDGFTLSEFPDTYRQEFEDNAHWLKLAFHARMEFPDRIYQNAEPETVMADYEQVENEIRRFAGEKALIAPPNVHWSMVKTSALPLLRDKGVRFLGGLFFEGQTRIGESASSQLACDGGYFANEENSLMVQQHKVWHDYRCDITMGLENLVLNLEPLEQLDGKLKALFSDPANQTLHMLTHEQYCFPFYSSYLPDHFERMELMGKRAQEYGYKFVFFNEGFLGNPND